MYKGHYISAISAVCEESFLQDLMDRVDVKIQQHAADPTAANFDALMSTRRELHLHMSEVT